MICEWNDLQGAAALFHGWNETMITACLQGGMGALYAASSAGPRAACAVVGDFSFFAGAPEEELVRQKLGGFRILVPQNEAWAACIERCRPAARQVERYALRKDAVFDTGWLQSIVRALPEGYALRPIDGALYAQCLQRPETADFVSSFGSRERFLRDGRGMVVLKQGRIVSGASSYARSRESIEIEVDTLPEERRRGLAAAASAALILRCLEEGLYPSWDAQNWASLHLAEKLGYSFSHVYRAYEVREGDQEG